jgi:hypothetical protein
LPLANIKLCVFEPAFPRVLMTVPPIAKQLGRRAEGTLPSSAVRHVHGHVIRRLHACFPAQVS